MAKGIIAYMRGSWSRVFVGARHAPKAAVAALLFQVMTASPDVADCCPPADLTNCWAFAGSVSRTMAIAVSNETSQVRVIERMETPPEGAVSTRAAGCRKRSS